MLVGILVGLAAIVVLTIAACIMYMAVRKHSDAKPKEAKSNVGHLKTVGVHTEDHLNPDVHVSKDKDGKDVSPYGHLSKRFRAVGLFIAATFGVLAVKLFSMQIVHSDKYIKLSSANATTSVKTPAPRGCIFDCKGKALVKNRSSLAVVAEGDVANSRDILSRLSVVLGLPYNIVKSRIQDQSSGAQSQRVVASDVTQKQAAYISEHSSAFDGVSVQNRTVRDYPYGALAAHALGYTGVVSDQELADIPEGRTLEQGDIVGKQGVESFYDNVLAGDHGERVVVSDADGNIVQIKSEIQPVKGSDVYLTIDANVQSIADTLLMQRIAPKGDIGTGLGTAGSIIVMDVEDGSIKCLANYPTFKPAIFSNGISQDTWNLYNTESSYYPLLNRAISGTYPAASTYKAFTGLAGLKYDYANPQKTWVCTGSWDGWNTGNVQMCWEHKGHGTVDFHRGIVVSCDTVFYEIGKAFYDNKDVVGDTAMQDVISKYNFGKLTGIDLEGEEVGRIPTPKWKAEYFKDVPTEAKWVGGDNTNMAIGQGYVLITPIQLAVAYGAIATGKLMKPHLLKSVKNDGGNDVATKQPEVIDKPDVDPKHLQLVRDALHGVGTEGESSASAEFLKAELNAAAKTGTAEVAGKGDYAWTVAYAPFDKPKYVVCCMIEEGGSGGASATPMAAQVLKASLDADENKLEDKIEFIPGATGRSQKAKEKKKKSTRTD